MVEVENSGGRRTRCEAVKLEVEDPPLVDDFAPLNKRSKVYSPPPPPPPPLQQWSKVTALVDPQPANYNPLTEPSPLGLRLRKSPSLLDLIQMKLSQANPAESEASNSNLEIGKNKNTKSARIAASSDKLKASNFPASLLRIGTWECVSRYEGDLVAKCYFAKHKLVWEVLDGGLKSKIEIQWSDITALKASCPENGPGSLDIVLAGQPLFFREINPQPRKHTLWQATSDFTGGQASIHRRHFLQCPQGILSKHFEKLTQCDPHLKLLSQQSEIVLDNPYFESRSCVFEDLDEPKRCVFDSVKSEFPTTFSGSHDAASPCAAQSSSSMSEIQDSVGLPETISHRTLSPSSVMDSCAIEEIVNSESEDQKGQNHQLQFKVPGLAHSMSMSDLVNHIGICISEKMGSAEASQSQEILNELTQHLLSDSHISSALDEKFLMSRVNSLCCLLQDAAPVEIKSEDQTGSECTENRPHAIPILSTCKEKIAGDASEECKDGSNVKQAAPTMSRKDSLSDLLLHLPRIASLPQILFNIVEDADNQAR